MIEIAAGCELQRTIVRTPKLNITSICFVNCHRGRLRLYIGNVTEVEEKLSTHCVLDILLIVIKSIKGEGHKAG